MTTPPLARDLLADLAVLISSPNLSDDAKRDCIRIAYEIGKGEGRCEGAQSMGDHLCKVVDEATADMVAPS